MKRLCGAASTGHAERCAPAGASISPTHGLTKAAEACRPQRIRV
eukprot:CAMPEP_0171999400 /NCGR_PEP_ID=MMETSP1041-20130122/1762_1 /TAXON_ID=464988 /ORGANISM="Hemiselmis andersenii, Strain CCMP439" /LENGTH=43 /DNA_ID= /DNA_START= /DNA_END= /DNA_ORIENTATION=